MSEEFIVIEHSNRNHVIAKRVIGHKNKYSRLASCSNRHQAQAIVDLLNGKEDTVLGLVREFHNAFGFAEPSEPCVPGLHQITDAGTIGAIGTSLLRISDKLKELAEMIHSRCARFKEGGIGDVSALLRMQLMVEELSEVSEAMATGDRGGVLHELADLRYVVDGSALSMGLGDKLLPAIMEIHRANMSKLGADGKPILDEAGRVVKGKNFKKADVSFLLEGEK